MSESTLTHEKKDDFRTTAALGYSALKAAQVEAALKPRNNDPLAPVLADMDPHRLYTEYWTDIGERSENEHTNETFRYRLSGGDLISDTGLSMRKMLERGLAAAREDVKHSSEFNMTLLRHEIQLRHLELLINYHESGRRNILWIPSLCPDSNELPTKLAENNGFKPERMMSSNWLFEPTGDGYILRIFTLDNHLLDDQATIYAALGSDQVVAGSTTEELITPKELPLDDSAEAVELIRAAHDQILMRENPGQRFYFGIHKRDQSTLEATAKVREHPEAYQLWLKVRSATRASLADSKVTPSLARLASQLAAPFSANEIPPTLRLSAGQPFEASAARNLMEYLRRQAIPHYIFGQPPVSAANHQEYSMAWSGGFDSVASAGAAAVASGKSYDGACPSSGGAVTTTNAQGEAAAAHGATAPTKEQVIRDLRESKSHGRCPCGKEGKLYGCQDGKGNGTFCYGCNEVWIDYFKAGKSLTIDEVLEKRGGRESEAREPDFFEQISLALAKYRQPARDTNS